jgi:hypothetical protein
MSDKEEAKTEAPLQNTNAGNATSPEGVLMLCIAGLIDMISLIPILNFASTVIGVVIIGGWVAFTRPGEALKRAIKKFLIVCGIELVPVISITPSWTWFVYKVLNDK